MESQLGDVAAEALQRPVIESELAPVETRRVVVRERLVLRQQVLQAVVKLLAVLDLRAVRLHPQQVRVLQELPSPSDAHLDAPLELVEPLRSSDALPVERQGES